jgi:hypothetical protein
MFKKTVVLVLLASSLFGCSIAQNNVFSKLGGSLRGAVDNVEDQFNSQASQAKSP